MYMILFCEVNKMISSESESLEYERAKLESAQAGTTTKINDLTSDLLYRIFKFLLAIPTQNSDPSWTSRKYESDFFNCTAPYNIARVCRTWRELVLATASIWNDISLAFPHPSDLLLDQTKVFISQHLSRSRNLPLTCDITFSGTFDQQESRTIAKLITDQQMRWRSVKLWFDVKPETVFADGCSLYDSFFLASSYTTYIPVPIDNLVLFTEDLGQLKELSINYASQYRISANSNNSEPGTLPSLKCLTLELAEDYGKLTQWLKVAPNITELNLHFYSEYLKERNLRSQDPLEIPTLHMVTLQTLTVGSALYENHDSGRAPTAAKASAFVVRFLTCPALKEIRLYLKEDTCVLHLHNFFLRSTPPLQYLDISLLDGRSSVDDQPMLGARIIDSLALLPLLSELRLRLPHLYDAGPLLQALTQTCANHSSTHGLMSTTTFVLLPALEHIDLWCVCAPPSQFVDLVSARWRARGRILQSFTLSNCIGRSPGAQAISKFPKFGSSDDLSRLCEEWAVLKDCISEGLYFEII